jgi:hypothetical protein
LGFLPTIGQKSIPAFAESERDFPPDLSLDHILTTLEQPAVLQYKTAALYPERI